MKPIRYEMKTVSCKQGLYQATIVNEMRDSLAFLAKGLQNFLDFRSVFPMFRLFNQSA